MQRKVGCRRHIGVGVYGVGVYGVGVNSFPKLSFRLKAMFISNTQTFLSDGIYG